MTPLALYIHWPFCLSKCPYCDFNSHVRETIDEPDFASAYIIELKTLQKQLGQRTISSIYFGGGTPSLMSPKTTSMILDNINKLFTINDNIEITLEANPATFEAQKFRDFKQSGINRLSIGIQSFEQESLNFLGREHSATEALAALEIAANTFDRYSFDLIYARPKQTLQEWQAELSRALDFAQGHLSLYQLTIEKGTPFFSDNAKGKFQLPPDDLAADMYLLTEELMNHHNMPAYEVSNYASHGQESQHNLTYWNYGEYLGIGAGAHSRVILNNQRTACMMRHNPEKWHQQVTKTGDGIQTKTPLAMAEQIQEIWLMAMRTTQGIERKRFAELTNSPLDNHLHHDLLNHCITEKLIEDTGTHIRPTLEGRLVLSSLTEKLLV